MWGFQNRVCPYPEKRNPLSFVNISPTLVIDTSMKRSSRVLHHGNRKIWFFFQKSSKFEFWFLTELKSPQLRQYQSFISIWYINGKVLTSTKAWKPQNLIFFFKKVRNSNFDFWQSWNHLSFVNISPSLVFDTSMERYWRVLQHGNPKIDFFFQKSLKLNFVRTPTFRTPRKEIALALLISVLHYISNWYVNGKVLTSTTTWEPKIWFFFFFKKVWNWIWLVFWLVLKSWNPSSRSQHAPIWRHRGCIVVPLRVDI